MRTPGLFRTQRGFTAPKMKRTMRAWGRNIDKARPVINWSAIAAVAGLTVGSVAAGTISGLATVFARTVVTPVRTKSEDLEILAIVSSDSSESGNDIILPVTAETTVPGTYSLMFDGGRGIARIGKVTSFDPADGTVQREIEKIYFGDISMAVRGRWTGFIYPTPQDMGFVAEDVLIPVERGSAPAWLIRPEHTKATESALQPHIGRNVWAIMVHGRGAQRNEGVRAVATARQLGMTSLLISYRNDGEAPAADDGRYGLGATEWKDVEAAIVFARENGAEEIVLFGWSMGAAVCLQLVDRSLQASAVVGLVLSGPVINWIDVLAHQARLNRLPEAVGKLGQFLITSASGRWITGLAAPVDLKTMNWVDRAEQLRVPTLILHSEDDDFVPIGPSLELAQKNPRLVTLVRFTQARHTREWNVDPQRWDKAVRLWLDAILNSPRPALRELMATAAAAPDF